MKNRSWQTNTLENYLRDHTLKNGNFKWTIDDKSLFQSKGRERQVKQRGMRLWQYGHNGQSQQQ
jgi:hypothetical protein